MTPTKVFLITGANSGIGLEATRKLAAMENTKIYMLCRSEEKAQAAITRMGNPPNLHFVPFDCYADANTLASYGSTSSTVDRIQEEFVDGVLLNAGGWGETLEPSTDGRPSKIAQLNLMAHVRLIQQLMDRNKLQQGTRIIASGSEACISGPLLDWYNANLQDHLQGKAPDRLNSYSWIKGITALYWSAFARRNPHLFVASVSPGAVRDTQLFHQPGMPGVARFFAKLFVFVLGNHSAQQAAQRYLDLLLPLEPWHQIPTGSFLAHRKGYTNDFGVVTHIKRGLVYADPTIQDKVWDAVQTILATYLGPPS